MPLGLDERSLKRQPPLSVALVFLLRGPILHSLAANKSVNDTTEEESDSVESLSVTLLAEAVILLKGTVFTQTMLSCQARSE